MEFLLVIPARFASTRLPGKPIVEIGGLPMIVRTYKQCLTVVDAKNIIVAVDDERIGEVCDAYEIPYIITSRDCLTGTDRVAEVAQSMHAPLYINVQGDEPIFNPADIVTLISEAQSKPNRVLCGVTEIETAEDYFSSACPKVAMSCDGQLLYMSRAPIPGNKSGEFSRAWRQVCAYSFPRQHLLNFSGHGKKTPLEEIEDIEILRFLELGHTVEMVPMSSQSIPVDYPNDVLKVEERLSRQ